MTTREEILHMEAGREMDALIAEKVMGWDKFPAATSFRLRGYLVDAGEKIYTTQSGDVFATFEIPDFSSDIAAAWEVVEKFKADGWDFFCEWASENRNRKDVPWALFDKECTLDNAATGNTMPLAICRAALLATMEAE